MFSILLSATFFYGCISMPKENKIDLSASPKGEAIHVPVSATHIRTHYFDNNKSRELHWWLCETKEKQPLKKGVFLLFLPLQTQYPADHFCQNPVAQVLASQGYDSAVMLEDHMLSGADISLKQDLKTAAAWWRALKRRKVLIDGQKTAVMALGSASIPGIFSAKTSQIQIDSFVLGGGFYDLIASERLARATPSPSYLSTITKEFPSGLEDFSIAYDFEWLAKDIWLFHCENDVISPFNQAEEFSKALRTAEFRVKWRAMTGCGPQLGNEDISLILNYFFSH